MKIAIIGSGISGLTAAYLLHKEHHVDVYEKADYIGGHTATKTVELAGKSYDIDTGFIVFNNQTYPKFLKLMAQIGVGKQDSEMSFSVSSQHYEYAGKGFHGLFAQKSNLLSMRHWRLLLDIVKFNKLAISDYESDSLDERTSLAQYLEQLNVSKHFINYYLLPMAAAIWSSSSDSVLNFSAQFFVRFFYNHGLLVLKDRPQWYVVPGGSKQYIPALTKGFAERIFLNSNITRVERQAHANGIKSALLHIDGQAHEYDHVIFACHSDQALALLSDANADEQRILGAISYQDNDVTLHTDERLLPRSRKAWSSWNYLLNNSNSQINEEQLLEQERATLTYNMNILQGIEAETQFNVSLNAEQHIDSTKVLGRYQYQHPVFSVEGEIAKKDRDMISGQNATSYCGAYWGNGFHEDGVSSAVYVAKQLGCTF